MLSVLIIILVLVLVLEGTTHVVYGKFLKDEDVMAYIKEFEPFEVNPYDNDIIGPYIGFDSDDFDFGKIVDRMKNGRFISKTRLCFLSSYYISNLGRVPIWSKSHQQIKNLYKELK